MTTIIDREEALAQIEIWTIAPGDIKEILPALAALRDSPQYAEQKRVVAMVTNYPEERIDRDVDSYLMRSSNKGYTTTRTHREKSYENTRKNTSYTDEFYDEDSYNDELSDDEDFEHYKQQRKTRPRRNTSHQHYHRPQTHLRTKYAATTQCLICQKTIPAYKEEKHIPQIAWIVFFILIFVALPLCWIPLAFWREPLPNNYCNKCKP